MKIKSILLMVSLCFANFLFAAPTSLTVLSASPKGLQNNMGRQAVSVHFNQPVSSIGEDTQLSSTACPLQITPKIEGTCRYSGSQTVLFEPSENWPQATRFTVTVPAGFTAAVSKQKLPKPYSFSFTTQVPQVMHVLPYQNEHWVNLNPTLHVLFSMPVNVSKIGKYVVLSSKNEVIPVEVSPLSKEEHKKIFSYASLENAVAIRPLKTLAKDTKYTLQLSAGLPAQAGTAGMEKEYQTTFYTFPELKVLGQELGECLPFTPSVYLSSPVRLKELARMTQVIPSSAKRELTLQEENLLGNEYTNPKEGVARFTTPLSFIKLEAHQTVQVTLKAGMQDIYGNRLAKDVSFSITNNGYCPAVDFSGGRGILESYLKPYLPIDLMNIASLPVRAARFNKENFIDFAQKEVPYCKEAPLSQLTFDGPYSFSTAKDRTTKTFLNLGKFQPTAKDSIIFSQVQVRRGNDKPCWISSTDNITDMGVTFKTSAQAILVWVTSLQTGKPLQGRTVELRSKQNEILWTGTTDENGLVRAPGWKKFPLDAPQWGQLPLYAFVTSAGGDAVVSNLWNDGMEPWRFNIDYTFNPQENQTRSFLFTDRGIYRPGETVYLKGILRKLEQGRLRVPGKVKGQLLITDSRGNEVSKKTVTLSENYGTFDTTFSIPSEAYTGDWNASFVPLVNGKESEDSRTNAYFQVETVEAAQFNVQVRPMSNHYLSGEEAKFVVWAAYQFGAPLAQAPIKWSLRQTPSDFTPKGYEKYNFSPYFVRENAGELPSLLFSSSGELDKKGSFIFTGKMPQQIYPITVFAQADVQSPARQDLFSRASVTVHPASFYLGTQFEQESSEAGKPVSVRVVAVTPEGKPTEATVVAEIYKEQWFSVRKTGLSGRLEWVSEKEQIPLPTQILKVGKKGKTFSFVPPDGGSYYVRVSSSDEFGRRVVGGDSTYVYGKGNAYWRQQDDDLLTLKQNKNEYKVGQTARIAVESPYEKATALVTVEREGILDSWVTQVKGGASYIPVKIKENYLPNVYVSVILIQGRTDKPITDKLDLGKPQVKIGYVNLNVVPSSKKIEVSLKPERKQYRPGEKVTLSLRTKVQGKPVPAQVTVMVVDEGILDLTRYQTPDLFHYFYGSYPLSVFTMDNRTYLIGQRNFGEKGENRGGGGSLSAALGGTDLRSNFKFTPYFKADIQTSPEGDAEVSFKLPDNLTKFRVMAVAVREDEFGHAQDTITVSKPIMITADLPRFVRKGDVFTCGAIVHNYEDKSGRLTVQAQAVGGVEMSGESTQVVQVPLGATRAISWDCRAVQTGSAELAFVVNGSKNSDGVKQILSVSSIEKPQTLARYGATENSQEELLDRPTNLNTQVSNTVNISLASTALLNIKGAITYLMTYPYDCLEQQLSKILPVIAGEPILKAFELGTTQENRKRAQDVLHNLPLYQYANGGFSYWKNGWPDPYVTAYALEISALAKAQGYTVPEKELKQAVGYLSKAFEKQTRRAYEYGVYETATAKAYITYVLSLYGKNTEGTFNTLYAKRVSLPVVANAYLLKAAVQLKRPREQQEALARELLNHRVYNPSSSYIDAGKEMVYMHVDNTFATALVLETFMQSGLSLPDSYQLATWLVQQLNAKGYWKNTSTSAQVLRGLLAYYQKQEKLSPDFESSVKQGEKTWLSHTFKGRSTQAKNRQILFDEIYGEAAQARLKMSKKGTGMLYYTLGQTYTPLSYRRPADAGFKITRTISALDGTPVQQIIAGERYKVTLHITSSASRSFVVAEDFTPAGFELVNTSLATESSQSAEETSVFNRTEQYDERIVAFADRLPAGTHTYSYVVSARVKGTFSYPAAWVSQMYEPEVFGRNATSDLVIH